MGDAEGQPLKKQKTTEDNKTTKLAELLLKTEGPKNDLFMIFLQMYALGDFEDVDADKILDFFEYIFQIDDNPETDFEINSIITRLENVLLDQLSQDKRQTINSKVVFNFSNMLMSSSTDSEEDRRNLKTFRIPVIKQIPGSGEEVIIDETQFHLHKRMAEGKSKKDLVNATYNHFAENFIFVLSIYNNIEMIFMTEKEKFMLMLGLKDWRSRSAELEKKSRFKNQFTKNYLDFAIFQAVDLYLTSVTDQRYFYDLYNKFISTLSKNDFRSKRFKAGRESVVKKRTHRDSYFNLSLTSELDISVGSAIERELPLVSTDKVDEGGPAEERAGGAAAGSGGSSAPAKSGDGSKNAPIVL